MADKKCVSMKNLKKRKKDWQLTSGGLDVAKKKMKEKAEAAGKNEGAQKRYSGNRMAYFF